MEFTNDILNEMQRKKYYNEVYSKYFLGLSEECSSGSSREDLLKRKSVRIKDCLNLWTWDIYYKNKVMDLQRVNRCNDNRFCPNCKKINLSSAIHNFRPHFQQLLNEGYNPYLVTLTIPNVPGEQLREIVDSLNKAFRKMFNALSYELDGNGIKGFSERIMQFDAGYKVLEITCNNDFNTYHPHFHCILFSKEHNFDLLNKVYEGPWSSKQGKYIKYSKLDIFIMKIWKMCFDKIRLTSKNYYKMSDDWRELYQCDIREMNEKGLYEVMKYTFKDTDIQNYDNFKYIFTSLENKRIRQGYGLLYNVKCEEEDGEKQLLDEYIIDKEESPDKLLTRAIKELTTVYSEYRKISRFSCYNEFENID